MHGRSPVAAFSLILGLACAAAAPASASAQEDVTADQVQAQAPFPVYEFTRTLGLPAHYGYAGIEGLNRCEDEDQKVVSGELRRGRALVIGRRWIATRQASERCAVGSAFGKRVRRVMILGQRVTVRRYCHGRGVQSCKGLPVSLRVHDMTFSLGAGSERTFITVSAAAMSLRAALRAIRSLRRVDLSRPVVELSEFMSPDQAIFCQISDRAKPHNTWCVMSQPFRSGIVNADGSVDVCNMDPNGCIPGGGSGVPVLSAGQTSRLAGFACTAEAAAITCTIAKGKHAGKGFRIDANAAVEVSPPG